MLRSKQFAVYFIIAVAITMFVAIESAFTAQELKVGLIIGGKDAAVNEPDTLKKAGIEFDVIGKNDYKLEKT